MSDDQPGNSVEGSVNPPRDCEPIKLDKIPPIVIHGYGCVVIIGMILAFMAWVAYLLFAFPAVR